MGLGGCAHLGDSGVEVGRAQQHVRRLQIPVDHRPRPQPVQPLQALRDAEQPPDADGPADLRVCGGVAEDGAEGAAAGQLEDKDEASLRDLQHAEELDQVAVVEPQAQPSLLQDLVTQARTSNR
eukprot:COSAG04_NODE_3746_length_2561_cov_4.391552_4_plen_124_part_00